MIQIKGVSKIYDGLLAVDNVSFELQQGEIVGLLGANGAGKSTIMKMITGILMPDEGHINVFGYDLESRPIDAKKHIGYLSEDNPLNEEMYVKEYLEYVANIFNLKNVKKVVELSIEQFGLENEYRKKINALSKGNRQKLGLAQAMIHNPDFLILDEPTTALDPNQQSEIKAMIKAISRSKIILFSTHILHDVESLASRIIIVEKGQIKADEPINNINSVESLFYNNPLC